jgi:tRNA A-37 threonylcarbamoyl transferase component Bud32
MISCRAQVYKLVQDLHNIGMVHKDLEPRNVVRARGGGFRLIDFSESRMHNCKESKVQ